MSATVSYPCKAESSIISITSILNDFLGSDFLSTAPHPHARPVQHSSPAINADENVQHAARIRTRTREEEHAALCVLDDWELTMTHALTSRRVCLLSFYIVSKETVQEQHANSGDI